MGGLNLEVAFAEVARFKIKTIYLLGVTGYWWKLGGKAVKMSSLPQILIIIYFQQNRNRFRCREQTDNCQRGGVWGLGEKDEGIRQYKLVVTEEPQRWRSQHRKYSQ